jgi:hypothetical protein
MRLVQEVVGDELTDSGLGADCEPNDRGRLLEQLIDAFSPFHHPE